MFLRVIDYPAGGEYLDFDFVTLTRDADGRLGRRIAPLAAHGASARAARAPSLPTRDSSASRRSARTTAARSTPSEDESVIVVARRDGLSADRRGPSGDQLPRPGAVPAGSFARARRRTPRWARRPRPQAAARSALLASELGVQVAQRQAGDVLVALVRGHLGDLALDVVGAGAAHELARAPSTPRSGSR